MTAEVHRERLTALLEHARKQVQFCEHSKQFATGALNMANAYNARHYEKEIARNTIRAESFRQEAAALEFAVDLIDRWEDAASDARFEDRE